MSIANELAYPWGNHGDRLCGLTKRELFAAMAMQGLLAWDGDNAYKFSIEDFADCAVKHADAIITALERK